MKNQYIGGIPSKDWHKQFASKWGLGEKEGGVFEGVDIPMDTINE